MDKVNLISNNYVKFKSAPNEQYQAEQTVQPEQDVQLPLIYENLSSQENLTLKEKIKKADMMGMVYPFVEHPIIGGVTAFTLIKGVDAYTNACGGEYEKSILGKATNFGDKIAQSTFWEKKVPKAFLNGSTKTINGLKNLLNKSAIYRAMKETPAVAEWQMPKSELISQEVRILEDFNHITEKFFNDKNTWVKLENLGLNKAEIEALTKAFNVQKLSQIDPAKATNWTILKRLGDVPEAEITKIINSSNAIEQVQEKLLKTLNLTLDDLKAIKTNPEKYIEKVKEVSQRVGNKIKIGEGHYKILGSVNGPLQFLERNLSLDQIGNRLHSIRLVENGGGAKTELGRFCAKALQKIHRGFTFGGGKLGMFLFIVPHLVSSLANVKKADKGEKVGTVANGLIESISWVFTFPLAIASVYALGGLENIGMGKDKVEKCRELIKEFNKRDFANKDAYKKASEVLNLKLKALRRVKDQNLLTKILRKVSGFLYQDLGMIKPYQGGNFVGNFLRRIPNKLKNIGCVPIRFLVCMFGLESLYRGLIEKGTKTIFGKHYNMEREMEYEAKKEEQKKFLKEDLKTRLYETQREKIYGNNTVNSEFNIPENLQQNLAKEKAKKPEQQKADTNPAETELATNKVAEEKAVVKQADSTSETTTVLNSAKNTKVDNYTYIPSSENRIKTESDKSDTNKYIPSQIGKITAKTFDNSGLEAALKRADRAEQKALQVLAGKFSA